MEFISVGRTIEDLMRIASSGASFEMSPVGKTTEDLMRLVAAAKNGNSIIYIVGIKGRTTEDLMRIGGAGKGHVVFLGDRE